MYIWQNDYHDRVVNISGQTKMLTFGGNQQSDTPNKMGQLDHLTGNEVYKS